MSPRLSDVLLSSQSDERLVKLARAGHERAFVAIVERYGPELHALARRLCSDGHGEDVVQQAFLSAFAALRSGADVRHLRGWLYRIVRNAAQRSQVPVCIPLDGATPSAETVEDLVQQRALAMTAMAELARLPARQRQAMVDTALAGMARADVASSMGLSEGAVRQLVHRARSTLRAAMTALTPWPLAQWTASASSGGGSPVEVVGGAAAGAASTGGFLSVKLGIVLASGAIATGVAAVDVHALRHAAASRPTTHAGAAAGHRQSARHSVLPVELAAAAPTAVDPAVATSAGVSRVVLRRAAPGSAGVVYVGASRRLRNAAHGVPVRRPRAPGGTDTRAGEHPDGGGGRTHTGAAGGGETHTSGTDGAAGGRGDGSNGGSGSGRQDSGGDPTAGRTDSSASGSGQGADASRPEAYAASSGSGSDTGGGGDGGARAGGGSYGSGGSGDGGGGGVLSAGGDSTGGGGGGGDTVQPISGSITGVSGNNASGDPGSGNYISGN